MPHSSAGGLNVVFVRPAAGVSHQARGEYLEGVVLSVVTLIGLHTTSQGLQNDLSVHIFTS